MRRSHADAFVGDAAEGDLVVEGVAVLVHAAEVDGVPAPALIEPVHHPREPERAIGLGEELGGGLASGGEVVDGDGDLERWVAGIARGGGPTSPQSLEVLQQRRRVLAPGQVDGVDAVFFGPGDLAASMGMPGQAAHPDVTAAIEDGLRRCRPSGKAVGALAPNDEIAERHIRSGFDFVSVANDFSLLLRNADAAATRFRGVADGIVTGKA